MRRVCPALPPQPTTVVSVGAVPTSETTREPGDQSLQRKSSRSAASTVILLRVSLVANSHIRILLLEIHSTALRPVRCGQNAPADVGQNQSSTMSGAKTVPWVTWVSGGLLAKQPSRPKDFIGERCIMRV
jgi:hypothetical protein